MDGRTEPVNIVCDVNFLFGYCIAWKRASNISLMKCVRSSLMPNSFFDACVCVLLFAISSFLVYA